MKAQPPDEIYLEYDGEVLEYREVLDVDPDQDIETFVEQTRHGMLMVGIPEENMEVVHDSERGVVDATYTVEWPRSSAIGVLLAEALLTAHDDPMVDIDQANHMIKALGPAPDDVDVDEECPVCGETHIDEPWADHVYGFHRDIVLDLIHRYRGLTYHLIETEAGEDG